jgi:hypothetical protein
MKFSSEQFATLYKAGSEFERAKRDCNPIATDCSFLMNRVGAGNKESSVAKFVRTRDLNSIGQSFCSKLLETFFTGEDRLAILKEKLLLLISLESDASVLLLQHLSRANSDPCAFLN